MVWPKTRMVLSCGCCAEACPKQETAKSVRVITRNIFRRACMVPPLRAAFYVAQAWPATNKQTPRLPARGRFGKVPAPSAVAIEEEASGHLARTAPDSCLPRVQDTC